MFRKVVLASAIALAAAPAQAKLFDVTLSWNNNGTLITHPVGAKVLPGVTRDVLLRCAKTLKIPVEERALSLDDAKRSQEVFITSSTRELVWVSKWDGTQIAKSCGTVTKRLHKEYRKCIADSLR